MSFKSLLLSGLLALVCGTGIAVASPARSALDFELSDGQSFVRLSELQPMPTLVNFWHADCAPCLRELPLLMDLAQRGRVRVVLVALHKPERQARLPAGTLATMSPAALHLQAPSEPRGLLRRFGNLSGGLPYSAWLRPDRQLCASRLGEVDAALLHRGFEGC